MNLLVALVGLLLPACSTVNADEPKVPIHVYARPGDPLRFVYEVGRNGSMGIVAEGPLRARCFLIGSYYRDLTLGGPSYSSERPGSVRALAKRLDLRLDEVPDDLITIWKGLSPGWEPYQPGAQVPIDGITSEGPYRLVGGECYRLFTLPPDRGYLLIAYYDESLIRVLRLPPPRVEFVVRPGIAFEALLETYNLCKSDFGGHLRNILRGRPVDSSNINGYRY